jgi:hypothetical protein
VLGGAAAGIRTRVSSLCSCSFEAWEAPVIDQVALPPLSRWELDHGPAEYPSRAHKASHDDRSCGKSGAGNKRLATS